MKHKRFKRRIDLIRYAVRRAIHRIDVVEPEAHAEKLADYLEDRVKKSDWLQWVGRKLKGLG